MSVHFEHLIDMENHLGDGAAEMESLCDFALDIRLSLEASDLSDVPRSAQKNRANGLLKPPPAELFKSETAARS